jgi:putative DNA primase/helicase
MSPAITRIELLDWLLPVCDPGAAALAYPKAHRVGPGWIYGEADVARAVAAFRDETLGSCTFQSVTQKNVGYTIADPSRLGLVAHRDGMVTVFCIDFDDHGGDGGNLALLGPVARFLGAAPLVFTSRSGKGFHAFFRLETPRPVADLVRWSKGWGFGRKGRPELFPKSEKLTQFWLPNEPNAQGGDTYHSGDFDSCVIGALPAPPSRPVTSTTLAFLAGESEPGSRNADLNAAAFELGTKGLAREEARTLCGRAARLCGLEDAETETTFDSGFAAGRSRPTAPGERAAGSFTLDGFGNAKRLVARSAGDLRYCFEAGAWLAWDGTRWVFDAGGAVQAMAKDAIRGIEQEGEAAVRSSPEERRSAVRGEYLSHLRRSSSARGVADTLELARSEPGVAVGLDDLDIDPWLFNCRNGTIDLRTGHLHPHQRGDLITKRSPAAYRPEASDSACPAWTSFLDRVFAGDGDLIRYIQRAVGYALTGRTDEQCMFFLFGDGSNGKSTLLAALLHVFGDYAQKAPAELITRADRSSHGAASPDLARLRGVRLVLASEIEQDARLNESRIKDLTGGDRVVARPLYRGVVEFEPTHTVFGYGNHRPRITGTDLGIWRRIRLVPFGVTFSGSDRVPGLTARLCEERDGILAWAVEGCLAWRAEGLVPPQAVETATSSYRRESDAVGRFLEDCCERAAGLFVPKGRLYAAYSAWCELEGEGAMSEKMLGTRLMALGFEERRTSASRFWRDLGLREGGAHGPA